jgi:hypothetical protein
MEEKKEIKESKVEITEKENTVKMEQPKQPMNNSIEAELDSMSKNQLRDTAGQLYYQNQQLMNRIKSMDMTNIFRRFDYLFKIMEHSDKYPKEFVGAIINEICTGMYPEEPKE